MPMREECKFFESRTYATGESVRKCDLDLAPEAPWRCPENCAAFQPRLADVNWSHGTLITPPTPPEPASVGSDPSIAALLESSLRRSARTLVPLAVMTCDLDGFRVVNERLGDAAGDVVLQAVASRLSHTLRQNDVLARFTADEFIVVAEEVEDEASAHLVARRLASAIAGPIDVDGVDVRIGVSIGFTLARGHERPQELLAEAERAMEGAKRAGKGRSMSFTEVVNGPRQTAASTIDWNELARTAPAEPIAPVIDTTPTEADE